MLFGRAELYFQDTNMTEEVSRFVKAANRD